MPPSEAARTPPSRPTGGKPPIKGPLCREKHRRESAPSGALDSRVKDLSPLARARGLVLNPRPTSAERSVLCTLTRPCIAEARCAEAVRDTIACPPRQSRTVAAVETVGRPASGIACRANAGPLCRALKPRRRGLLQAFPAANRLVFRGSTSTLELRAMRVGPPAPSYSRAGAWFSRASRCRVDGAVCRRAPSFA